MGNLMKSAISHQLRSGYNLAHPFKISEKKFFYHPNIFVDDSYFVHQNY